MDYVSFALFISELLVIDLKLDWACKESYWNHVEYFPAHISGIKMSHARELLSILTHARAGTYVLELL